MVVNHIVTLALYIFMILCFAKNAKVNTREEILSEPDHQTELLGVRRFNCVLSSSLVFVKCKSLTYLTVKTKIEGILSGPADSLQQFTIALV